MQSKISTHAPLAGRDMAAGLNPVLSAIFQLTRPLRGATPPPAEPAQDITISTHAPLAGRDIMDWFGDTFFIISTHAPLAGRDPSVTGVP